MPADPRPDLPPMPDHWTCHPVVRGNRSALKAADEGCDRVIEMYPDGNLYIWTSDEEPWTMPDLLAVLAHLRALSTRDATVTARSQPHTGEGER